MSSVIFLSIRLVLIAGHLRVLFLLLKQKEVLLWRQFDLLLQSGFHLREIYPTIDHFLFNVVETLGSYQLLIFEFVCDVVSCGEVLRVLILLGLRYQE